MPHEYVFDQSKAHVFIIPTRLTVRGGESFEEEVEDPVVLDPPELSSATAGDSLVDLVWVASTTPAVTGYFVKYGTSTGVYGTTVDVGAVTGHQVTGLTNDTEYFFAVSAYDASGNESEDSNELSATPEEAVSGYTYFRLTLIDNSGGSFTNVLGTMEFEIRDEVGGSNLLPALTKTITSSDDNNNDDEAFDGVYSTGNGWTVVWDEVTPQWVQVQLDPEDAITPAEYGVGAYPDGTTSTRRNRSATEFTLEGSNNGSDWDLLDSQTGVDWSGHSFSVPKLFTIA